MGIYLGKVARRSDPLKLGRCELVIPSYLGQSQYSDWAWQLRLPGLHLPPKFNDTVLVFVVRAFGQGDRFYFIGPIENSINGISTAPRAEEHTPGDYGEKIRIIDFDEEAALIWSGLTHILTLLTGANDLHINDPGVRLAMLGDTVRVFTGSGPADGFITSASVPAQTRFPR